MSNFPSLWSAEFQKEMDRMFRHWPGSLTGNWNATPSIAPTQSSGAAIFSPPTDLEETEDRFLLSMDLPGLTKNDVKIEIDENRLRVFGERKEERTDKSKHPYRTERYYGSFERMITLPKNTRADLAEAGFENGVLKISIPKAQASIPKRIPISEKAAIKA